MRARYSPLWSLLVISALSAVAAAEAPTVVFDETAVTVTGAAPGARLALLGVGRLEGGYMPAQIRFSELLVADGLGEARFESEHGTPTWSVWAVADVASGEVTVVAPAGAELRWRAVPARALRNELDGLDDARRFLEVLLVRPESTPGQGESGAWVRSFGDGGEGDGDGAADGNVRVAPSLLDPLGDAPAAPERFAPGDLIVAVDPDTLEVWTASVPGR